VALLAIPATLAQAADCQDLNWSQDRLSKFKVAIASLEQDAVSSQAPAGQAIYWSQKHLADFDAAIASLEQDIRTRKADAAGKAEAALNDIRVIRDGYRVRHKTNLVTTAQAGEAPQLTEEAANAFWAKVNAYLDVVKADLATRQAAMQTRFLGE
jgi:hypothetical protein